MTGHSLPLEAREINFAYDSEKVLKGVSGRFYQGTFYGIAGPNGSGKTTWLKIMAGMLSEQSGDIILSGDSISELHPLERAKRVSYVPQMFNIPYAFTIEDVVRMGRYPYTKTRGRSSEDDKVVNSTLKETNLYEMKDRFVNELSGGELQRVIVARAIAQDTDVVLLDEPISHLDIHYQHEIVQLLKRLCRDKKKTVVAVLHELNVTMNHCDHIFLLKNGEIVTQGEPHQVLTSDVVRDVYDIDVTIIDSGIQKHIQW